MSGRPAGAAALRTRFELYGRYAALLEGQLEALGTGDLDRFEELVRARDAIAVEVDRTAGGEAGPSADAVALLAESQAQLQHCIELDRQVVERLRALRTQTLDAVRALDERAPQLRSYLGAGRQASRLDVRL